MDLSSPFLHPQGADLIQALDVCDLVIGGSRWGVGIGIEWGVWGLRRLLWGLGVALQAQLQAGGRRDRAPGAGGGLSPPFSAGRSLGGSRITQA